MAGKKTVLPVYDFDHPIRIIRYRPAGLDIVFYTVALGIVGIAMILLLFWRNGKLVYEETGTYVPYLEAEHFPFEMCSYQILFMTLALVMKDRGWRKRLYALMYTTCIAGAGMGSWIPGAN